MIEKFILNGMTEKQLLDSKYTVTKEQCIALIRENLHADDSDLDEDAQKIYDYFTKMGIHFLLSEFIYSIVEDDEDRLDSIAAEI
jgi:hypothetical protein